MQPIGFTIFAYLFKMVKFLRMPNCYQGKNGNIRLFYIITHHSIYGMSVYSKGTK